MAKSLAEMTKEVYEWCISKGWEPDPERQFGTECALLHTEISEAFEAYRTWGFDDMTPPQHLYSPEFAKPEGVGSEFADLLIRLLHYAFVHMIDLEKEYERKMAYNRERPYRHGNKRA
jgi:NTP pyrophosphatase (non-canonical NTP hydrolase)